MENRSFQVLLTDILKRAEDAHHTYVAALPEQTRSFENANWQEWYAKYVTRELAPILTALQEHETVCEVKGTGAPGRVMFPSAPSALPPFYDRKTQEEIGGEITSRFHAGE